MFFHAFHGISVPSVFAVLNRNISKRVEKFVGSRKFSSIVGTLPKFPLAKTLLPAFSRPPGLSSDIFFSTTEIVDRIACRQFFVSGIKLCSCAIVSSFLHENAERDRGISGGKRLFYTEVLSIVGVNLTTEISENFQEPRDGYDKNY